MSRGWKDKDRASNAGRKAGVRRTEQAIAKLIQKARSGEKITMADSRKYAKFMMNAYGLEHADDWFFKKYQEGEGKKLKKENAEMKTFKDLREKIS